MINKIMITLIYIMVIFTVGCSNQYKNYIFSFDSEKQAIIDVFGKYSHNNKKGVVLIYEKENKKDRTYIYYVTEPNSLDNYKKIYKINNGTKESLMIQEKVSRQINEEINKEIMSKIEQLYKNRNIDRIRIEAGILAFNQQEHYNKQYYNKPGEKEIGNKIIYINTYDFTRDNYSNLIEEYYKNVSENKNIAS